MRRSLAALLAVALAVVLLAGAPPGAEAWKGPCIAGTERPTCHFWRGKVTFVADGDTLRVDIAGDGTSAPRTVRLTGINAMELRRYSKYAARRAGACHAREATALIERHVRRARGVVRLSAQDPRSMTGGRLRRTVEVRVKDGWRDLARLQMEQGQALWLPNGVEWAHNHEYHQLAEQAAAGRLNLYDPARCGPGPDDDVPVSMRLNWDADGRDGANLNGEWVQLRNLGGRDLSLAGWWFRDSRLVYNRNGVPGFQFPAYAVIPAGGSVTLHMGCDPNAPADPARFYWCQRSSVFENVKHDGTHVGDGGYLFDPHGDLRASMMYPCVYRCEDPLQGRVKIAAHAAAPESISITNVSDSPVDLDGYLVKLHVAASRDKFVLGYPLGSGSHLGPGETLELRTGGSPADDERLVRTLRTTGYLLPDRGSAVSLRTFTDVVIDCYAWGRVSC